MSGSLFTGSDLVSSNPDTYVRNSVPILLVEAQWFSGGSDPVDYISAHASGPGLSGPSLVTSLTSPAEDITDSIRVSDVGYTSLQTDTPANTYYPPFLLDSLTLDRRVNIEPWQNSAGASWGTIQIARGDGRFDSIVATGTPDGRPIRILSGHKSYSTGRSINIDPAINNFQETFVGYADGLWRTDTEAISIDVRDASYRIERPLQTNVYEGTGNYEGPAELKGVLKPITRGGGEVTNLILQSELASGWEGNNTGSALPGVITSNFGIAPNGTSTAARVVLDQNSTSSESGIRSAFVTGQTNPHDATISVWMKSNTAAVYTVHLVDNLGTITTCVVDSQWRRFRSTTLAKASTQGRVRIRLTGSVSTSSFADILVWGAQWQLGTLATSYIPTTTAPVTLQFPVKNITPTLIDSVNRIYQYNDAPGRAIQVYERGAAVFTNQGDTTDLYSGTTNSGSFRTDNSRGLFQLGAVAQGEITVDAYGNFPNLGLLSNPCDIALGMLTETYQLDAAEIDTNSFTAIRDERPWISGFFFNQTVTGAQVLGALMRSVGGWAVPSSAGKIRADIQKSPNVESALGAYNAAQVISCASVRLPASLSPPPFRIRVGFDKRYTIQTDVAFVTDDARRQLVSEEWTFANWEDLSNLTTYRQANDPPVVETFILEATGAALLAEEYGKVFGPRRSLWEITVPSTYAFNYEVGSVVNIQFPAPGLSNGAPGIIVGDRFRFSEQTYSFAVLV